MRLRSNVALTAAASNGVPSANFTPSRTGMVTVLPPSEILGSARGQLRHDLRRLVDVVQLLAHGVEDVARVEAARQRRVELVRLRRERHDQRAAVLDLVGRGRRAERVGVGRPAGRRRAAGARAAAVLRRGDRGAAGREEPDRGDRPHGQATSRRARSRASNCPECHGALPSGGTGWRERTLYTGSRDTRNAMFTGRRLSGRRPSGSSARGRGVGDAGPRARAARSRSAAGAAPVPP